MKELHSGNYKGYWWRITQRTNGIILGLSFHWPTKKWSQWQFSVLILDLTWGKESE